MKIGGTHTVQCPRERAYSMLQDPEILAQCMPGCDRLTKTGEDAYEMQVKLAIASIQGLFSGKVRISDQTPPESFRLAVEGNGKVGFMKGEGLLKLAAVDGATEIRYDGDVQVGGMIAGVGQRLLDTTSRFIIRKFFEKLASLCAAQ
ncbi:MAG: carbon monoxide dehydrogenase subunit G [Acidobacteria bacterium]|nr:carbon monoxide dehydrogenase subunit G [Acidobacteriota bacterium]